VSVLPLDLTEILRVELEKDQRDPDGLLHPSTHLAGSLRHVQLDIAGAPRQAQSLISMIRLKTGTFWHDFLTSRLIKLGVPAMHEVNLTPWLPPGWAGTADFIPWHPEHKAFTLADYKTTKGEAMRFIRTGGPKDEHVLQTSTYWHALDAMGIPLLKAIAVYYLPINDTTDRKEVIEPELVDFSPIPLAELTEEMTFRKARVDEYVGGLPDLSGWNPHPPLDLFLTGALEPEQPRIQKLKRTKDGDYDVLLVPHWSAAFCPFPDLCGCSEQGQTKIGFWSQGEYYARPGYEDIEPEVSP
jgi:hypothetical protein